MLLTKEMMKLSIVMHPVHGSWITDVYVFYREKNTCFVLLHAMSVQYVNGYQMIK